MLSFAYRIIYVVLEWMRMSAASFWNHFSSDILRASFLRVNAINIEKEEEEEEEDRSTTGESAKATQRFPLTKLPPELLHHVLACVVHPLEGGLRHMRLPCSLVCSSWHSLLSHEDMRPPLPSPLTGEDRATWDECIRKRTFRQKTASYMDGCFWWECAWYGHLRLMRWANLWRPVDREEIMLCRIAALRGRTEVLKWATSSGCHCDEGSFTAAAKGGHIETLLWIKEEGARVIDDTYHCAVRCAAEQGHLHVIMWAKVNGYSNDEGDVCAYAAKGGQMEVLRWAKATGLPLDSWAFALAAEAGQLEAMSWLKDNGCPFDEWTCRAAARGGQLEALRWLRGNGCPCDSDTCGDAARMGQLEVLRWAVTDGCPFDADLCRHVARGPKGRRVLEWLDTIH